jgi:hypothetical protein
VVQVRNDRARALSRGPVKPPSPGSRSLLRNPGAARAR